MDEGSAVDMGCWHERHFPSKNQPSSVQAGFVVERDRILRSADTREARRLPPTCRAAIC